jgi:hypothetical protein
MPDNEREHLYPIATQCDGGRGWIVASSRDLQPGCRHVREDRYCCSPADIARVGLTVPTLAGAAGTTADEVVEAVQDGIESVVKQITDVAIITGQKEDASGEETPVWKYLLIGGFVVTGVVAGSLILYQTLKKG